MQFQCSHNCGQEVWSPRPDFELLIEEHSLEAKDPLPLCPTCKAMARPNILMFSDWDWDRKIQISNIENTVMAGPHGKKIWLFLKLVLEKTSPLFDWNVSL